MATRYLAWKEPFCKPASIKTKEVDTAGNSSLDMVINVVNLNLKTGSSYIGRDIDLILDSSLGKSATKSVAILAWQSINELSWSERLK